MYHCLSFQVCQTREGQTFSEEAPHGETKAAESLQQQKKIQNDLLQMHKRNLAAG